MNHLSDTQLLTLQKKLEEQKKKLLMLHGKVQEQNPANDDTRLNDNASPDADASEEVSIIESEVMDTTLDESLTLVDMALERIKNKTYGLDKNTGEPIPFERLEINPTADTCV